MGDDVNACIVTVPTEMRHQPNNLLTKKRMETEIMLRRRIM